MQTNLELDFVSGSIFDLQDIPKSKKYLYKYFESDEQKLFVKYFLSHGDHAQFVEHTGIRFRRRWRQYLTRKLRRLEAACQKARDEGDIEMIAIIETGGLKVRIK